MPSVYIKTYGCQMNERDSEAVAAQLVAKGCTFCAATVHFASRFDLGGSCHGISSTSAAAGTDGWSFCNIGIRHED